MTLTLTIVIPRPCVDPSDKAEATAKKYGFFQRGDDYDKEQAIHFYRYIFYKTEQ